MTKTFNRQQAKAYAAERLQAQRVEQLRLDTKADLDRLREFRDYFLLDRKIRVEVAPLIAAIDDHAEKLTGDRRFLHAQNTVGPKSKWD